MMWQKRLSYGSSSYQVPAMSYVPRSARGKRSVRKKIKDNQICAFDLLADVAGRLLSESENSVAPLNSPETLNHDAAKETIKEEELNKEKSFQTEALDQQSCNNCVLGSDFISKRQVEYDSKDTVDVLEVLDSYVFVKPNISDKDVNAEESTIDEPYEFKGELETPLQAEVRVANNVIDDNTADMYSSEDPMELDTKPPPLISSDSSAEVPVYRNNITHKSSFIKRENEVELSIAKDDDENSSGCTHPSILPKKAYRLQRKGDRRLRKLLASRHWKLAPANAPDTDHSDCDVKPNFVGKKMLYTRQRTQKSLFKKKKLFDRRSVSACDGGLYCKGVFDLFEKTGIKSEANESNAKLRGANGALPSTTRQTLCHKPSECNVKLSIKSFNVPELFIEVPEDATVGSLKSTVMETLTALLGGGLHVGILLQGKKIQDDSQTLRQVGLSYNDKIDCLGFTLEPNTTQSPAVIMALEDPHLPSLGQPAEPLDRIPPIDPPINNGAQDDNLPLMITSCFESDHDSVHSPADAWQLDKAPVESQALISVLPVNAEPLAMVPSRKSRRSEVGQRRIRRPFTVSEVEALVQAVEQLGTGRWRDVKLLAFDNAKHRTYVDLKDKWKTLVHTARISPQQRRGEPVPQELLDRVLLAHAYWSQQQVKLHVKPPPLQVATPAEPCLLH